MLRRNKDGEVRLGCGYYIVFYVITILIFLGVAIYIVAKTRNGG